MPETPHEGDLRILLLAPTSNDAALTAQFLETAGLRPVICADIPELCAGVRAGCGAILLAEEALAMDSATLLSSELESQPSWSDLPLILITGSGNTEGRRQRLAELGPAGNVSIIERPVRPGTLVSASEFALRSRRRQYQVQALLHEREELLLKAEQQARIFDTTLSAIADFAYIFDREGRFVYSNKPLLALLGLPLSEVAGKTFFELPYPPELAARLQSQISQVVETGQPVRDETPYTNPTGHTGYYEYIFTPVFSEDGTVSVVAGSTRDNSERRRNEETLRESDRRKDEFLAMLSHELRNPLASVANAASLLKEAHDAESRTWAASVIERQSRQLAHLIDDLLDVSRITTGKIRLRKEVRDVATLLDNACESARPLLNERRHELVCQYEPQVLWVDADPTRFEQIVLNLLTNAAKYTPPGGRIVLSATRLDAALSITVEDNGMGIAPERLPEMFKLFAQGEQSIDRSEGGLGIGLTIVQKLAELHDGTIEAHSDGPNRGSTFRLHLPAAQPPALAPPLPTRDPEARPLRVLIVDDNLDTAQALGRLLTRSKHEVLLAHNGPDALEKAHAYRPEAVVLDIGLPGMDGFQVARALRQDPSCASAVIIAVTGYGQAEDRIQSLDAGFDHHLVKPVNWQELNQLLTRDTIAP